MGLMIRFSASEEEIESLLRFLARRTRNLRLPSAVEGAAGRNGGEGAVDTGYAPRRRAASGGFFMTPLVAEERSELRFRRTPRPFLNALRTADEPLVWGLRLAADGDAPLVIRRDRSEEKLFVDPEESRLIVLALGAPRDRAERRRDGVIEVRDWVQPEPEPEPVPEPSEEQPAAEGEGAAAAAPAPAEGEKPKRRKRGRKPTRKTIPRQTGGVLLLPQTYLARNLVERAARRLRRRGHLESGRWYVPPLPQDDGEEDHKD